MTVLIVKVFRKRAPGVSSTLALQKKSHDLPPGHVHDHSRDAMSLFLFLRCADLVGILVHGKTVDFLLHREVFQLAVMIRVVHLKDRDRTT
jgi:hypothetical protein